MADYGLGSRVRACRLSSQLPELWPEGSHAATPTSPEAAPLRLVPALRPSACLPRTPPCVHPALLCPSASSPLPMRPSAWLCPCHHPPRPAPLWLPHAMPLCWLCPPPGGGGRQALCRGCQGNPDSDWLPRHVHKRVHSDSLLSGHQASGLPASSCNLPPGISTWLLQRPPTHTFKTGLPLAPASHLLFTHQARPPLPPPAPPRVSQFHTRGLCRPWRLLPDMSPEDNTAPLPFSPHRSHSEV